jgi:hypothetical protein
VRFSITAASLRRRSRLIRNATIAALIGSTLGAVAGLWSVRDRKSDVAVSPMSTGGSVAASPATPPTETASGQSGQDLPAGDGSNSTPVATKGVMPSTVPVTNARSGPPHNDRQTLVQRARTLAEVPDVYALVALRESIIRGATERGEQESPATRELVREIERYLAAARELRLKLDGEALRRDQAANASRTGRR